ncbi:hypothetical protein EUGRSUZ_D00928 [Eucalyptus grandis]|uniref:Uncharacterized protein n=2 Tax=Eucalyptus grandis TaxID=71139 RepID=A0ACC3L4T4_EUCGR|nr:hypothetical protein EUGRSUZ_D00928 [Eucalyptus grandis]
MARGLPQKKEKDARESRLQQAIANDDVDELHNLIVEERELLDRVSKHPFPNTPLHIAAVAGKTNVAMEMAILKPSFARKLNPEGYSPMHLALQHEHYHTVRTLMTLDPKLIRVQGRCGITPLHFVAGEKRDNEEENMELLELLAEFLSTCKSSIEDLTSQCETAVHIAVKNHNLKAFKVLLGWLKRVYLTEILNWKDKYAGEKRDNEEENMELLELLAEFLSTCKSSIEDLTSQCETAVHIAVKNHNLEAFKVLLGWLKRVYLTEILNWKDKYGNTVLHIAVFEDQPEIIRLLRGNIKLNAKNYQHKTALEIYQASRSGDQDLAKELCSRDPNHSLSQFLRRKLTYHENFVFKYGLRDESIRDIILLVATLITTATYQLPKSTVVTANSSGIAAEKPHQAGKMILSGSNLYQFMALNSSVFVLSIVTICWTAAPLLPHSNLVYSLTLYVGVFAGYSITALLFVVMLLSWAFPTKKWRRYDRLVRAIDSPGRQIGNFLELKNRK